MKKEKRTNLCLIPKSLTTPFQSSKVKVKYWTPSSGRARIGQLCISINIKACICHIPQWMRPVIWEPSGDADGAQLTGGRGDDGAVGAICKTEHIVTLYTVHSPPVCHAPSARVRVASLPRAVSTAKTWALNDSQVPDFWKIPSVVCFLNVISLVCFECSCRHLLMVFKT